MRILVAGGTGFIGARLIGKLMPQHEVVCVSRSVPRDRLADVEYIECDLSASDWKKCLPGSSDVAINLAQSPHYRDFAGKAEDIFEINVRATFNLLEWSRASGVRRFLQASTANVYSESDDLLDESCPCEPRTMYGVSKLCAEKLLRPYESCFEVAALRFFTVFGSGQVDKLLPDIVRRIRTGETIDLAQGIGLLLTPIEVGTLVEAVVRTVAAPRLSASCYNLCGEETLSLSEAVDILSGLLRIEPNVKRVEGAVVSLRGSSRLWAAEFGELGGRRFKEEAKALL